MCSIHLIQYGRRKRILRHGPSPNNSAPPINMLASASRPEFASSQAKRLVYIDHNFLARLVAGLRFIEREAGEWVTTHAVTVETLHCAYRDFVCHRPVIPWFVQANYDNGWDISRKLFPNAVPKCVDGLESPSKERLAPVKVIIPMMFCKVSD